LSNIQKRAYNFNGLHKLFSYLTAMYVIHSSEIAKNPWVAAKLAFFLNDDYTSRKTIEANDTNL